MVDEFEHQCKVKEAELIELSAELNKVKGIQASSNRMGGVAGEMQKLYEDAMRLAESNSDEEIFRVLKAERIWPTGGIYVLKRGDLLVEVNTGMVRILQVESRFGE